MDKVTAHPVRAEADGVESTARLRLVFGVPAQIPQLFHAVGKLALAAVLAQTALGEGATQFSLIARGGRGDRRGGRRGAAGEPGGAEVTWGVLGVGAGPAQTRCRGAAGLHHADGALRQEGRLPPVTGTGQLG